MRPKIFVSSTYYDMKYMRENVETLLENLGFDPILFESGDITFEHQKALDVSCFNEIRNANMMVLIVGGRYGSATSTIGLEDDSNRYEKHYTSVTKGEFLTAQKRGIPILAFVEGNVLTEYETFKKNRDIFYQLAQGDTAKINFAYVDDVNVFEFIDDLYVMGLPIFRFSRFEDIENQFKSQISGMLYLYLDSLVSQKAKDKVSESVDSMKNLIERMEKMVQQIGEKVLEHDKETLERIKREQEKSIATFCIEKIGQKLCTSCGTNCEEVWHKLSEFLTNEYIMLPVLWEYRSKHYDKEVSKKLTELRMKIKQGIERILAEYEMDLYLQDFDTIEEMAISVVAFAKKDENNLKYVIDRLAKSLSDNWLPF